MANKKINQLVSKTSILSTDLFGIGDATTGQLFKKTIAELQAAIGGAVISVNGLVGTVVLDTDDIQELATPTNKYFTDARARGAISLTVTGNSGASTYSSGTGVLNVPTYTLAGLGGITASFLSGTSGISYNSTTGVISYSGTVYTDASIRALLSGGTGISYNSTTGAISYSGTVYTDSSVRALISLTTTGTSGASTYNNTTGVINVPEYTLAGLGGISLTSLSGGTGITYNNTTGAISYSGTVYTDASVRALISATGNISYNSTTGVISTSLTQYTDALARASVSLTTTGTSGASTYNSTTGVFNIPNYGSALSGYLPLTGGTLTGALGGTSATFSGNVGIGGGTPSIFTAYSIASFGSLSTTTNGITIASTTTGNGLIEFADGTTGNQAYRGYIQYAHTTDSLILGTAGSDRVIVTSSGNVGIGISPQGIGSTKTLEIGSRGAFYDNNDNFAMVNNGWNDGTWKYKQTGTATLLTTNSGDYIFSNAASGTQNTTITWNERMRITSAGSICVNTTSASFTGTNRGNITIGGAASALLAFQVGGTGKAYLYYDGSGTYLSDASGGLIDISSTNQGLRITAGGNHLMGTTSDNGERLYVSGAIRATGTITANSDITLKKNLLKIENALEKVEQINGYTYEFKADDSKRHAGVIAQEIQMVLPEIVNKGNDGLMGVEYGNISALLIEAIKEQNIKIKNLETLLASK